MKRPSFQEFAKWTIISALIALMTACGASKHVTQVVHDTRVDTVYLNSKQYDSIYIFQDRVSEHRLGTMPPPTSEGQYLDMPMRTDTLYIKDKSIEYRYKLLRDTIKVVQRDSIPYEVTITETKEITRPLTWFDRVCRFTFFFLLGVILCFIYQRIGVFRNK